MRKLLFITLSVALLASCNNKKKDEKKPEQSSAVSKEETKPAATGQDAELTKWLSNKMLVSTLADPKYDMWNNLKLKGDGTCTDKDNSSATWSVSGGKFIFHSVMELKEVIEKRAEDTLVFKADIGKDAVYVLKPL